MKRVLIVDDDPLACRILARMLGKQYDVATCGDGQEALRHFATRGADLILTDLKMPKINGLDLLSRVREISPDVLVFVITGFSSIESAVAAIKKGACDYIAKPYDPDDVQIRIARAFKERELEGKVRQLQEQRSRESGGTEPLTANARMREVLDLARKVARTDSNVLIQGETGVGKEVVARYIHQHSPRAEHPFVAMNCGALAEGVLESELFGHEKGAFTGAAARRSGYFELANRGTLMLDEIGTTDHNFQIKLLRVLQDRLIYRVGSTAAVPVDVRIIAATNLDLSRAARDEGFRTDLYYRLSVVTLHLPPLRERREDIPLLAENFVRKYRHINPRVTGIAAEAVECLLGYDYPGNVRELENIIERGMILETGERLGAGCLLLAGGASNLPAAEAPAEAPLAMEAAEQEHIRRVLVRCGGKKTEAARVLGINKSTLWRKMKKFDLEV